MSRELVWLTFWDLKNFRAFHLLSTLGSILFKFELFLYKILGLNVQDWINSQNCVYNVQLNIINTIDWTHVQNFEQWMLYLIFKWCHHVSETTWIYTLLCYIDLICKYIALISCLAYELHTSVASKSSLSMWRRLITQPRRISPLAAMMRKTFPSWPVEYSILSNKQGVELYCFQQTFLLPPTL